MDYTLEKLEVYQLSEAFADIIWDIVLRWDYFLKDKIGKQMVRSSDSISANMQKAMAAIIIKKANNFSFMPGVLYRKPDRGYQNVKEEK